MKLVRKNKVAKFSRASCNVEGTFRRGMIKATAQNWKRVLIIGEGNARGGAVWSTMLDTLLLGLTEKAREIIHATGRDMEMDDE